MNGHSTELLLFQVGARVYASAVGDVVRIGAVGDGAPGALVEDTSLGTPYARHRGIVVSDHSDGTEATLVVDGVLGVREVADAELHALPSFAAAVMPSGAVTGLVLFDEAPMLLIDLPALIRERRSAAATPQPRQ